MQWCRVTRLTKCRPARLAATPTSSLTPMSASSSKYALNLVAAAAAMSDKREKEKARQLCNAVAAATPYVNQAARAQAVIPRRVARGRRAQ